MAARQNKHIEVVQLLIEYGAFDCISAQEQQVGAAIRGGIRSGPDRAESDYDMLDYEEISSDSDLGDEPDSCNYNTIQQSTISRGDEGTTVYDGCNRLRTL